MSNLGGYENKQKDKMPGYQIIWNGMDKLKTMTFLLKAARANGYELLPLRE